MKKFLLKFIIVLTLIATVVVCIYVHFCYYRLHLISPEFSKSDSFKENVPYDFTITDTSIKMTSWNSQEAILKIDISNSGHRGTNSYCDVSLTLVDVNSGQPIMFGVETDTTQWKKNEITSLEIPIQLNDIGFGQYDFYLRIWDDNKSKAITLDNNLLCEKNGYYIGSLSVSHLLF